MSFREKLLAKQTADIPKMRPGILDLKYIESLRRTGFWFDGTQHVTRADEKSVRDMAPAFALNHK